MSKENMIPVIEFCDNHNIEISFVSSLQEAGLIEITTVEETEYIYESQLCDLEKIVRLYYDLDINLGGIEAVINLLERMSEMQDEITRLRNRLRLYEGGL
jgi:chaperone modulatory protein CbpM